jgi:L-iditol 2-dehydrogenase
LRALVLTKANNFEFLDCPEPQIGSDDVLIQVKACGICGSDVHGMDGSTGRRRPPIIMGHEASGIIAAVGTGVSGWKIGERVTFDSTIYCGKCDFCGKGLINLCDQRRVLGVSCEDYRRDGAFAEYICVPQHILYRLPDRVSFEQGAMVEALSIAVHAVGRAALSPNDKAVVIGAGMIGLLVVQVLKATGCSMIAAVDIDQSKLELAKEFGADVVMNSQTCDVTLECRRITDGRGADIAFEVVGITPTIQTAISSLRKGGKLTLVGNIAPEVNIPLQVIVTREMSITGSCASCGEYPACLDMIADGRVNVDRLISATAALSEGAEWFKRLYNRQPGLFKVILDPSR